MAVEEPFEEIEPVVARDDERLVVDLQGYEGPLDVLLTLARQQKVDITRISILELAEQYLAFITEARRLRLEIAADYLVMAAWLAFLKSRLLLPEPEEEEGPSGTEMAEALTFQLRRLEAMREAGANIMAMPRLGHDFFLRGAPEPVDVVTHSVYRVSLFDLLKAYADQRQRQEAVSPLHIAPLELYSMDDALKRLGGLVGNLPDWQTLTTFLPPGLRMGLRMRSAIAATFAASLELTRSGKLQLRQDRLFGPIYVRKAPDPE